MNIFDLLISRLRKINPYDNFVVSEVVEKNDVIKRSLEIVKSKGYAIILDAKGCYKEEILKNNGLYCIVNRVNIGIIDMKFADKDEEEDIVMTDYSLIGIGFIDNFAQNSIRKKSMGLGASLIEFYLKDAPCIEESKYIFIDDAEVLKHWGLKTEKKILEERNFKFILVGN